MPNEVHYYVKDRGHALDFQGREPRDVHDIERQLKVILPPIQSVCTEELLSKTDKFNNNEKDRMIIIQSAIAHYNLILKLLTQ